MSDVLEQLERLIAARMQAHAHGETDAARSRVVAALTGPQEQLLRKLPEEATEVLLAITHEGNLVAEMADLWYYCMLVLHLRGVPLDKVLDELAARMPRAAVEKNSGTGRNR